MKILMTGHSGFLGASLLVHDFIPVKSDIRKPKNLEREVRELVGKDPFTLVHAAAKTDVVWCQNDENAKELFDINVKGTQNVATVVNKLGGKLLFLSTCHVFSGDKRIWRFSYKEKHRPSPSNQYGLSKYIGESMVGVFCPGSLVVRIGKIYDERTISNYLASDLEPVPSFLYRNFIHADDVAELLRHISLMDLDSFYYDKITGSRLLHLGNPDQNLQYSVFVNMIRQSHGMELAETRNTELVHYKNHPTPWRVLLDTKQLTSLINHNFRSL